MRRLTLGLVAVLSASAADPVTSLLTDRCSPGHTAAALRKLDSNLVLRMVTGDKPRMPKNRQPLTASEVATLRSWAQQSTWWSLKPLVRPAGSSIDEFIQARLKTAGLKPSPEADRRTLVRRVYYDLHGLPPSPAEIDTPESYRDGGELCANQPHLDGRLDERG